MLVQGSLEILHVCLLGNLASDHTVLRQPGLWLTQRVSFLHSPKGRGFPDIFFIPYQVEITFLPTESSPKSYAWLIPADPLILPWGSLALEPKLAGTQCPRDWILSVLSTLWWILCLPLDSYDTFASQHIYQVASSSAVVTYHFFFLTLQWKNFKHIQN